MSLIFETIFSFQTSDRYSARKVQDWLTNQQLFGSQENQPLSLITRWKLDSANELRSSDIASSIAITNTGIIAFLAFTEQPDSAFLLLLNPNPDVSPTKLSSQVNWSPLCMLLQGKEYLVAHQEDNNVHVWDIQSRISKIVLQGIPLSQLFLISYQHGGHVQV